MALPNPSCRELTYILLKKIYKTKAVSFIHVLIYVIEKCFDTLPIFRIVTHFDPNFM